jgi:hypothetical protein
MINIVKRRLGKLFVDSDTRGSRQIKARRARSSIASLSLIGGLFFASGYFVAAAANRQRAATPQLASFLRAETNGGITQDLGNCRRTQMVG